MRKRRKATSYVTEARRDLIFSGQDLGLGESNKRTNESNATERLNGVGFGYVHFHSAGI
jgi:hypothetical protein